MNPNADTTIPLEDLEADLHIASLVVHVRPDAMTGLRSWLLAIPGVEIHAEDARGKLVVVTESHRAATAPELLDTLREQPGVIDAALVYHEILPPEECAP